MKLQWSPDELRTLMQQFMERDTERPAIVRRVAKRWRSTAAEHDTTYDKRTHEYIPRDQKGGPAR